MKTAKNISVMGGYVNFDFSISFWIILWALGPAVLLGFVGFAISYVLDRIFSYVLKYITWGQILLYMLILLCFILYITHKINIILSYF